ncbi:unnamed protein product, partial [Nesidiocoris tenuis]
MALVQYWGCGVRHVQLLLLTVCGIVGGILIKTVEASIIMVDEDTRYNNFTLFDDVFRLKVKTWTSGQKYILKNAPTVPRFLASLVSGLASTGRWNLKYFLLMNFAVLSAQSYVIPLVAKKVSFDYLLAAVLMQGFFYGMIPPTTTAILARWTPHQEIGRTVTLVLSSRCSDDTA